MQRHTISKPSTIWVCLNLVEMEDKSLRAALSLCHCQTTFIPYPGAYFTMQPPTLVDVAGMSQITKITGLFHSGVAIAILTAIPLTGTDNSWMAD